MPPLRRVYFISHVWDEHGGEASIYTTDGDKARSLEGWHPWGYRGGPAVAADGGLYVSDPSADRIRIYRTADMAHVRDVQFRNPGRILVDRGAERAFWVIDTGAKGVRKIGRNGEDLKVSVADCKEPVAMCFDARGNLLVTD